MDSGEKVCENMCSTSIQQDTLIILRKLKATQDPQHSQFTKRKVISHSFSQHYTACMQSYEQEGGKGELNNVTDCTAELWHTHYSAPPQPTFNISLHYCSRCSLGQINYNFMFFSLIPSYGGIQT